MIDIAALAPGLQALVDTSFASADGRKLRAFLAERQAAGAAIFPPQPLRALTLTPFDEVRVMILGQERVDYRFRSLDPGTSLAPIPSSFEHGRGQIDWC